MNRSLFSGVMSIAESATAFSTENWKQLRAFNFFRLFVAGLATGIAYLGDSIPPFGSSNPGLFAGAASTYFVVALTTLAAIQWRRIPFETLVSALTFVDIILLTLLMHASQGLDSGIGLLLLVAVASASLMLSTRLTILFAALATIALGLEVNWSFLTEGEWVASRWNTTGYTRMGLLGMALFVSAMFVHFLAHRLRATEALAQRRGVDLDNLAQLNEFIIARMNSGVLVCEPDGEIHLMNKTASTFLGLPAPATEYPPLPTLSPDLAEVMQLWQNRSNEGHRETIHSSAGYTLLPRFLRIGNRQEDRAILIFLDDADVIKQQAAQLKMSALARLTASIAHEIRNPLGAIAHAAQLMDESGHKSEDEARLLRIIQDQSRRMNTIIENVTQLSRRDKINLQRIDLDTWVAEFIRQFILDGRQPPEIFNTKEVTAISVCVDSDQLQQVVGNLCTNALRHSPAFSGQPLISIRTGVDPDQRPFLDVIDRGNGIPPEIVDSIFDPFFTTTAKGTGLGLYIARELCEGNAGRLDYFPGDGGIGSRFRVTFARAEECGELVPGAL